MGAVFGPVVFLWIVFGAILGGAVHDYMTGMVSCRNGGASIVELSRKYLGNVIQKVMCVVIFCLLILVVTVFISAPAALLSKLTSSSLNATFWMIVIIVYYLLAAVLPVDKIIGKLYPVFGILLAVMAAGILGGIVFGGYTLPEITLQNLDPNGLPVWPFMFVTVACGAISGFHGTQSPMVAKCLTSERKGKRVFGGAMIAESVIALIWAAAGVAFYGATEALNSALAAEGQAGVVYEMSRALLGTVGSVMAIVGIVVCPVTSGDTALRAVRLMVAERLHIPQKSLKSRLLLTVPLLALCVFISQVDYSVLWRYLAWTNQVLAMFFLWVITAYLIKEGKHRLGSLITAIPAAFMSGVTATYILAAPEGLQLSTAIAYPVGAVVALIPLVIYVIKLKERLTAPKQLEA